MYERINKDMLEKTMLSLSEKHKVFCSEADFKHHFVNALESFLRNGNESDVDSDDKKIRDNYNETAPDGAAGAEQSVRVYMEFRRDDMSFTPTAGLKKKAKGTKREKSDGGIDALVYLNGKKTPIEFKYKTRTNGVTSCYLYCDYDDDYAKMRIYNNIATDENRYEFLCDIKKIEELVKEGKDTDFGYAIFLTNDETYWKKDQKNDFVAYEFQFDEKSGVITRGEHKWHKKAERMTKSKKKKTKKSTANEETDDNEEILEEKKKKRETVSLDAEYPIQWKDYASTESSDSPKKFRFVIVEIDKTKLE